jgi:hypothetical protein
MPLAQGLFAADYVSESSFCQTGDIGFCQNNPQNHWSGRHQMEIVEAKLFWLAGNS